MYRHMQISTGIWSHLPLYSAQPQARLGSARHHAMPDAQGADRIPGYLPQLLSRAPDSAGFLYGDSVRSVSGKPAVPHAQTSWYRLVPVAKRVKGVRRPCTRAERPACRFRGKRTIRNQDASRRARLEPVRTHTP